MGGGHEVWGGHYLEKLKSGLAPFKTLLSCKRMKDMFRTAKSPFIVICNTCTEEDVKLLDNDMKKAGFKNYVITNLDVRILAP